MNSETVVRTGKDMSCRSGFQVNGNYTCVCCSADTGLPVGQGLICPICTDCWDKGIRAEWEDGEIVLYLP